MSGRKCSDVTISQDEYNELLNNTRRADNARRAARLRVQEERERNSAMQSDFELRQWEMQDEYREGLNDLSDDIQNLERQQSQRLEQVRRQSAQDLKDLDRDVNRRIEDQGKRFQQTLNDHRREVTNALQAIQNDIQMDRKRQRAAAQSQIDDLQTLFKV